VSVTGTEQAPGRGPAEARIARLCSDCVRATGVDGGGVTVLSSQGTPVLVHATDSAARALEELQFTLGEGPGVDAVAQRTKVLVDDLQDPARLDGHWPAFRSEAGVLGVRALFAFPIVVGSVALGSLDLYRRLPGGLDRGQVSRGMETVEAVGSSLISPDGDGSHAPEIYPMTVHQAAGMVMVQLDTSIDEALVRLRAAAFQEGTAVTTVAGDVIDGRRRFTKEEL
jgi:GAF domain-containing protein